MRFICQTCGNEMDLNPLKRYGNSCTDYDDSFSGKTMTLHLEYRCGQCGAEYELELESQPIVCVKKGANADAEENV